MLSGTNQLNPPSIGFIPKKPVDPGIQTFPFTRQENVFSPVCVSGVRDCLSQEKVQSSIVSTVKAGLHFDFVIRNMLIVVSGVSRSGCYGKKHDDDIFMKDDFIKTVLNLILKY
jgi:hypothetical protein